jgi:hypothetical protein
VAVYRDGNQLAAQIGPDRVEGIADFGDTIADALRDLAFAFAEDGYVLRGNAEGLEAGGRVRSGNRYSRPIRRGHFCL